MGRAAAPRGLLEPASTFLDARLQLARLEVGDAERLGRILEHATRLSAEQLDVERVGIWLFDAEHTTLTECLLYERSKQRHAQPRSQIATSSMAAYFAAIESERVVVIEDALRYEPFASIVDDYLAPQGIGSLLDATIFRQGRPFGIVCHEHVGPPRTWLPREIDFAASVADMVALYFEEAEIAHAQKRLLTQEKELAHAERLASVGVLARHVAHDLNNAVAPILMCAAQLRTALATDRRLLERVEIILDAAEHGVALARRLLSAAAGAPHSERGPIHLDTLLTDSIPLLRAVAGDDVELVVEPLAAEAYVEADAVELVRAIINLVTNAREAMPNGGRVVLRTAADDAGVRLEITDSGKGMTPEEKDRLFEPFFTTKPGRGTGLGLAGVRSMVDDLRATVDVKTAPDAGTTFSITFPAVSSERSTEP